MITIILPELVAREGAVRGVHVDVDRVREALGHLKGGGHCRLRCCCLELLDRELLV